MFVIIVILYSSSSCIVWIMFLVFGFRRRVYRFIFEVFVFVEKDGI